jgi:hypothetical protein
LLPPLFLQGLEERVASDSSQWKRDLYSVVFPMAQQELRTPYALRDRDLLTDNALQRDVSFTVKETFVSVHSTLKNFYLAARLEPLRKLRPLISKTNIARVLNIFFTTEPTESTEEKPQCGFSMGRVKEH